ncbi:MAG: NAD(P)-dependent alcohol dehydrogenase [Candidatus Thorarchaeota archaeon SMTZ1-45]|nr:MAG: alcohol dehydrogenase [Candidatus Thorarchaeota archaeon SMTZ1-45]
MKAIVITKYGGPEVLQYKDVEKPSPAADQVLVEVKAASLNASDFEAMRGSWASRLGGPLRTKHKILGTDIAGTVEMVGSNVTKFQPGEEVLGDLLIPNGYGAFAEYACAPEKVLALKPASMTFEQASTYPESGIIALQSLRGKREIQPGQKVLINGAGGGMGSFGIQIAKYYGAEVTGVDSAIKIEMMKSIGADHVLDYKEIDFTKTGERYDTILDTVARRSLLSYRRALNPNGMYIMVGGSRSALFQALVLGPLISRMGSRSYGINPLDQDLMEDYDFLAELFEAGKVVPVIDRSYPLSEIVEAFHYFEEGHARGKVVITMN